MKYSLRSVMIVGTLSPAVLAGVWLDTVSAAFIAAALLPILFIAKWRAWGSFVSVIIGWSIVFLATLYGPRQNPGDAAFPGLWLGLGLGFMLAWCLPILG